MKQNKEYETFHDFIKHPSKLPEDVKKFIIKSVKVSTELGNNTYNQYSEGVHFGFNLAISMLISEFKDN